MLCGVSLHLVNLFADVSCEYTIPHDDQQTTTKATTVTPPTPPPTVQNPNSSLALPPNASKPTRPMQLVSSSVPTYSERHQNSHQPRPSPTRLASPLKHNSQTFFLPARLMQDGGTRWEWSMGLGHGWLTANDNSCNAVRSVTTNIHKNKVMSPQPCLPSHHRFTSPTPSPLSSPSPSPAKKDHAPNPRPPSHTPKALVQTASTPPQALYTSLPWQD